MRSSLGALFLVLGERRLLVRGRLVLLALDELDRVVDQVGVEVFDLLLREIDLLEAADDLVIGEKPFLLSVLDELLELLDLGKSDIDGEHVTSAFSRGWTGALHLPDDLPRHTKSRVAVAPALTIGFGS